MSSDKERQILMVMRKVLGSVVRDTTPAPGTIHALSQRTIEDVKLAFELIAARERELADEAGIAQERPFYTDEPRGAAEVVPMSKIGRRKAE